jgi:hypothetical protein
MGGGTSMTGGCKGISNFFKILQIFTIFLPEKSDFTYAKDFL